MRKDKNGDCDEDVAFLLFEYKEGDLSKELSEELENRLALESNLQEELIYWEEAHIEQEFYNTEVLEERLLIIVPLLKNNKPVNSYFLGMVIITGILSFLPLKIEKESDLLISNYPTAQVEVVAENPEVPVSKDPEPESFTQQKSSFNTSEHIEFSLIEEVKRQEISPLIPVEYQKFDFLETSNITNLAPPFEVKKHASAPPSKKAITNQYVKSRKHEREITRARERAIERRREAKYLKGKIPYVVPLSPNF